MFYRRTALLILLAVLATGIAPSVFAQDIPLQNWSAPASYTPAHPSGMKSLLTDVGNPSPFIPITPCRIADTRGFGFTGQAGPPSLTAGVARNFAIGGTVAGVPAQCGIPANAVAVSFNFAVTSITASGNLVIYPQGGSAPTVSSLNYQVGFAALSNAAVIPLGASSGITILVNGSGTVDVIIDVNGYYGPSPNSNRGFAVNSGTARSAVFHTTGGLEAVDAYCDTPSTNCWAYYGTAGTGDYGAVIGGGRGSSFTGFDDSYPAVDGLWTGTTGANFGVRGTTLSNDGACAAGVKGIGNGNIPCPFAGPIGVLGTTTTGVFGVVGYATQRGVQGSRTDLAGAFQTSGVLGFTGTAGVFSFQDVAAAGAKPFVEPHPMDASKQIVFIAAEANEAMTMYRGRGRFHNGVAVLSVPEEFQFVTNPDSLSIQVTPIGELANVAVMQIGLDGITLRGSRNVEFFYMVQGTRKGFEDRKPIEENVYFVPDGPNDRMPNYPAHIQKRLIDLGVYNQDGTVNMKTAESIGWAAKWRADAAAAKAVTDAQKESLRRDQHSFSETN